MNECAEPTDSETDNSDKEEEEVHSSAGGHARGFSMGNAIRILRGLLLPALATSGSALELSSQSDALVTGAEPMAEWRSSVQQQMRTEQYSRQAAFEFGSRSLHDSVGKHTAKSVIENARMRTAQRTVAQGIYRPCTFANAAYRHTEIKGGHATLRRIRQMLVDLGASISVMDTRRAKRMERDGAADIVRYGHAVVVPARVAGGGYISIVGIATIEFCLRDSNTSEWRTFKERFHLVEGSKTCILGMTFHAGRRLKLGLEEGRACYALDDGSAFETDVDIYAPGMLATAVAASDPLVFTRETQDVVPWGCSIIEATVPESFNGSVVTLSRLPELSAYANKVGLMVPEASFQVNNGRLAIPVFNRTPRSIQLPAMTAVGRFSSDMEHQSAKPDMTVEQIVDALHIESVDAAELEKKKGDVKLLITAMRQGYFSDYRLGRCSVGEFHVDSPTVDSGEVAPPNIPSRPLNKEQIEAARKEFDKMVKEGVLVPSTSPWGAPIVMVRKPKGGWRLCLDYRAGNAVSVKQHYPLPRIQECMDRIGNATHFASLDVLKAFWQIRNSTSTQPKTAINFPWGKWEMRTMPMGMQAASATYQRIMDALLRDLDFCVGYIDDALIASDCWETHLTHVALVLDRIGGAGLVLNPAKCAIGKSSVLFLGHQICRDGNRPDPSKLATIRDATLPQTRKDMHHWVALAGFYAPFMENFAVVTEPLHVYIHSRPRMVKGKPVQDPPGPDAELAFAKIKEFLVGDLVLARPIFSLPFVLKVDASVLNGMGCILAQVVDGVERPVAYWSTRWIESTSNWAPVEHECFAFYKACARFYDYLASNWFTVFTDSEPLQWLNTLRRPRGRMACWILDLQAFDYTCIHRAGKLNRDCDALSRLGLASSSIHEENKLSITTPFECTLPNVSVVEVKKTCPHRWRRCIVAAVISDGVSVLVVPSYDGGGRFHCFPSVLSLHPEECNRALALRALRQSAGRLGDPAFGECPELGGGKLHKGDRTAYVAFGCSTSTVREHVLGAWCSTGEALWIPLADVRPASLDDMRMVGRLRHSRRFGGRSSQSMISFVGSMHMAHPLARPGCLPDGRAKPDRALYRDLEVYDAMRLLALHMARVAGTAEDFIFCDYEYDMTSFGIDLVQVAAGRLIFVFDTLRNGSCMNGSLAFDPNNPMDESRAVPSLRHWLTHPGTVIVMQACGNDTLKLRSTYSIQVTSVFDTQYADAVLHRLREGRRLELLVRHYLGDEMERKNEVVHRPGQFRQRPLPGRLLEYAWQDVSPGPALYRALRCQLSRVPRHVVQEMSRQRADSPFESTPTDAAVFLHDSTHCLRVEGTDFLSVPHGNSITDVRKELVSSLIRSMGLSAADAKTHVVTIGKPKKMDSTVCFFATGSPLVQSHLIESCPGWSRVALDDCIEGNVPVCERFHRFACRAWHDVRQYRDTRQSAGVTATIESSGNCDLHASLSIQRVWRGHYVRVHASYCRFLPLWASCCIASLVSHGDHRAAIQLRPALSNPGDVSVSTVAPLGRNETGAGHFSYSSLEAEEVQTFERQPDDDGMGAKTESLTSVVVVAHGGGKLLLLERNATSQAARSTDDSPLALPSLKTTIEVYGKYKAQHALSMLFGPVRSYSQTIGAYQSLQLRGVLREGNGRCVVGVYECNLSPDIHAMLPDVFAQRKLTPTMAALYPGFTFMDASLEGLSKLDALAVSHILKLGTPEGPSVAGFDVVDVPPLPPSKQQGDASRAAQRAKRRTHLPGVQPSGLDVQDDIVAEYPGGSRVPRARNVTELFRNLIPADSIPDPVELQQLQEGDGICAFLRSVLEAESGGENRPPVPKELKQFARSVADLRFVIVEGVLHMVDDYGGDASDAAPHLRVVLPEALQQNFVKACHDGLGHPGVKRTLRAVRARVWWPGVRSSVKEFVGRCPTCLFNKITPHKGEQLIPDNGSHPWHSVQMDIVHLHKSRSGMEKALVFYDRFTRDVEAFAVRGDVNTDVVLSAILFEIYPRHGAFKVLYTDRGSNLISDEARQFYKQFGIDLRAADAEMHTAVAGAERFNATLREMARAVHFDHGFEWDLVLPLLVFWYKQLAQTSSGYSPFFLNHGRDAAVLPWDLKHGPRAGATANNASVRARFATMHLAWQCAQAEITRLEDERRAQHAKRYQTNVKFAVNDRVLIRQAGRASKMDMPFVGPFRVVETLERDRYRLVGRQGAKHLHHEFHLSRLKLWPAGADEEDVYLDESYFDVEKIVGHRRVEGVLEFQIRWQGYSAADDTFLAFSDMNAALGREAYEYMKENDLHHDTGTAPAPQEVGPEPQQDLLPPLAEDPAAGRAEAQADARKQRLAARQVRMGNAPASEVGPEPQDLLPPPAEDLAAGRAEAQADAREQRLAARQRRMGNAPTSVGD